MAANFGRPLCECRLCEMERIPAISFRYMDPEFPLELMKLILVNPFQVVDLYLLHPEVEGSQQNYIAVSRANTKVT